MSMVLKQSWLALLGLAIVLTGCSLASGTECVDEPGSSCLWAGTGETGLNGDGHDMLETQFYWPEDIEFGPDGTPWILDWNNHMVRRVLSDGTVETVVGDFVGDGPPDQSDLAPPGAPGRTVRLNHPTDIEFAPDGTMYLAAWHNHKIRRIDPETGLVMVAAGRGPGFEGDGGPFEEALLDQPKAIDFGPDGTMYILDQRNQRIRKVSGVDGTITTVVGTGEAGYSGDGGPPRQAQLNFDTGPNPNPSGALVLGPDGALYVADALNYRIRRVDFDKDVIETIAGAGTKGFSGDGGPATAAQISAVADMEFGPDGRLYIADTGNNCVRAIDPDTGNIEMVWNGDGDSPGLKGRRRYLNSPMGIAFDQDGHLYIADTFNSRIIRLAL